MKQATCGQNIYTVLLAGRGRTTKVTFYSSPPLNSAVDLLHCNKKLTAS